MAPAEPLFLDDSLLGELEKRWREHGLPIVDALRPGLTDDEMDQLTTSLDLRLPEEARRWWRWHDGAFPPDAGFDPEWLGPGSSFFSLATAVEACEQARAISGYGRTDTWDGCWQGSWFPITRFERPPVIDCSVGVNEPVPIRSFFSQEPAVAQPGVRSFGELVKIWIDAFDLGAWDFDPTTGVWNHDIARLDPAVAELHLA